MCEIIPFDTFVFHFKKEKKPKKGVAKKF